MRTRKLLTITAVVAACLCICWGAMSFAYSPSRAAKQAPDAQAAATERPATISVVREGSATQAPPASLQALATTNQAPAKPPVIGKKPAAYIGSVDPEAGLRKAPLPVAKSQSTAAKAPYAKPAAAKRPATKAPSANLQVLTTAKQPLAKPKPPAIGPQRAAHTVAVDPRAGSGELGGPRQGGDTCASATVIGALPYSNTGTTVGYVDDYDSACPYTGSTSPDVVYSYTPAANESIDASLCTNSAYDTKLYIYAGVCSGTPVACNDDACSTPSYPSAYVSRLTGVSLTGGTTYYLVVDGYGGDLGNYTIDVTTGAGPCNVVCPPGATPEGEPVCSDEYVDATNGGCNSSPPVFGTVACGETICGTSGTFLFTGLQYRDTDWYQIVTTEPTIFTWSVTAEFPLLIFAINGTPGCAGLVILGSATADPCVAASVTTTCMPPGTYWFWVGPSVFSGVPCGVEYVATLTCTPCAGCVPDFNLTAPGTISGNTCGAGNDCALRPSEDQIVKVTIPTAGNWTFSLCSSSPGWDSYIYLGTTCCGGEISSNDDFCGYPPGLSQVGPLSLTAGTYYLTIEGFGDTLCGAWTLIVSTPPPCDVVCPPGGIPEGEPLANCADEGVDNFNGGCNSTPYRASKVYCGETICGTSGTFLYTGLQYRDTDWYLNYITKPTVFTWSVKAEFPLLIFVIDANAGCGGLTIIGSATADPCVEASITTPCLPAGAYWFWVGPSVFTGVPCGSEYAATLTCTLCSVPTGACCVGTSCAATNTEAQCATLGGQWHAGETCPAFVCPQQGGDTCASAAVIGALPYSNTGTTVGYADDYDSACPYTGSTSPDVVYSYTPAANETIDITLCLGPTDYDTKVYIYAGECSGTPIACNDDACSSPQFSSFVSRLTGVSLTGGTTYYIVVDGYGGDAGTFTIDVTTGAGPCKLVCPPGATPEGEPVCADEYVDATNGGCNSAPEVFGTVACGETICGTSGTFLFTGLNYRDTDWYQIVTTAPTSFTWSATAEFPLLIFAIDGTPGCAGLVILGSATADPCLNATVATPPMPAGTYWFWVGPSVFSGVPCGVEYVATLTCTP